MTMMDERCYAVIMAGGRGTRFWPRSRKRHAKQVLKVFGDRSLIQQTVERLLPLVPAERIWVITNHDLRPEIARQLPEVPPRQIVAEPAQRNTAPCIGLAAHILRSFDPEALMGVFPADHLITTPKPFQRLVRAAYRAAARNHLVVFGIRPRWAETGYGYIEFPQGFQPDALKPVPVVRFREKPDLATARRYLRAGRFYWNSGIFFWRASVFLEELEKYLPETARLLAQLPRFADRRFTARLREIYPRCENISVDYAVLEKSRNVVGFPSNAIEWNDVGSWNAVYELLPHDADGNAARGDALFHTSSGNYVDAENKLVALLGVRNLIVVDTPDALLVADRAQAQKVGEIVKALEKQNREDLL
jgi:mannose-1-phosphate guanylyltransferase